MPRSLLTLFAVPALALQSLTAFAAADIATGEKLYYDNCTGCHVKMLGGDGTAIHTRPNSIIHSAADLRDRVAFCDKQTGVHLDKQQQADIVGWLNQKFYKFK